MFAINTNKKRQQLAIRIETVETIFHFRFFCVICFHRLESDNFLSISFSKLSNASRLDQNYWIETKKKSARRIKVRSVSNVKGYFVFAWIEFYAKVCFEWTVSGLLENIDYCRKAPPLRCRVKQSWGWISCEAARKAWKPPSPIHTTFKDIELMPKLRNQTRSLHNFDDCSVFSEYSMHPVNELN